MALFSISPPLLPTLQQQSSEQMIPAQDNPEQSQSYDYFSSEQILIEFGQLQTDLVGSLLTPHQLIGPFGIADLYPNLHDRLLLLDPHTDALAINDRIYRGVVVKTARKKDVKSAEAKGDEEEENEKPSEENMFESSEEEREEKRGRKGEKGEKKGRKTRIIRKLKKISEKKGKEE